MALFSALPMLLMEGNILIALPYIIDTLITVAVTITALVLAILAYRNTKKILKKLEGMESK